MTWEETLERFKVLQGTMHVGGGLIRTVRLYDFDGQQKYPFCPICALLRETTGQMLINSMFLKAAAILQIPEEHAERIVRAADEYYETPDRRALKGVLGL